LADNVFVNGRAVVHKKSAGKSTAFPDVCLCPPTPPAGPVPVPLTNLVIAADLGGGARSVTVEGSPIGKRSSFFAKSTGNEISRPTGGGVLTMGVQGAAHFQTFSPNVLIEGEPAVRHLDVLTHNHIAPNAPPGNTPPAFWMSAQALPPTPIQAITKRVSTKGKAMISLCIREADGQGPHGSPYEVRLPDGQLVEGEVLLTGRLAFTGLPEGICKLRLPEIDKLKWDRRPPSGGTVYEPGKTLSLQIGKHHDIWVPEFHSYWVELGVAKRSEAARDDRFILRSDDQSYEVVRTVADDLTRTAEGLTLEFPRLRRGLKYTLLHDRGAEGGVHVVFFAVSFEKLFLEERDDPTADRIIHRIPDADDADAEKLERLVDYWHDTDEDPDAGSSADVES
jgi:hypothetical protein